MHNTMKELELGCVPYSWRHPVGLTHAFSLSEDTQESSPPTPEA